MAIEDQIRDKMALIERLQKYQLYHQAKYLTGEQILPSDQRQIIEQAIFTYSSLGKALEKQTKKLKIKEKNKLML